MKATDELEKHSFRLASRSTVGSSCLTERSIASTNPVHAATGLPLSRACCWQNPLLVFQSAGSQNVRWKIQDGCFSLDQPLSSCGRLTDRSTVGAERRKPGPSLSCSILHWSGKASHTCCRGPRSKNRNRKCRPTGSAIQELRNE